MPMCDNSLREFCQQTASSAATPGGGSVSALVGALGASLAEMVASLTVKKAGFESVQEEMFDLLSEGESLRDALLTLIDADCAAFGSYMEALAMPKGTEEERAARRAELQAAARRSAEMPMEMARCSMRVMPLVKSALALGNPMAASDARMAAILVRAAVRSAVINVRVNLPALGDEALAAGMEAECAALEEQAAEQEAAILSM